MLNVFPIQFLAPLAYALLRVCIGLVFLYFAQSHFKNRDELKEKLVLPWFPYGTFITWYLILIEFIIGAMYVLGFYTQIAALLAILYTLDMAFWGKKIHHPLLPRKLVKILIFFVSLSLFITGAGIFAFDLPI
jgi:uncharacterized membrane protein YphA (DoxX/SURF4 family)